MADQFLFPIEPRLPPPPREYSPTWAEQMQRAIRENIYRAIADRLENLVTADVIANQPTADGTMRFFYATDTGALYFDDGTWNAI